MLPRNKLFTVIFLLVAVQSARATKPTLSPKSADERKKILATKYSEQDSAAVNDTKLAELLKRDCKGFAYAQKDYDLTPDVIVKSYPDDLVAEYLKKNILRICPPNMMWLVRTYATDRDLRKKLARDYANSYKGDQYWPYTSLTEMQFLFNTIAEDCGPKDEAAFRSLYCRYAAQIKNEEGWKKIYLDAFTESCKKFKRSSFHCG